MAIKLNPAQKIAAARALIRQRAPYFRAAVLGAVYKEVPRGSLDTMAITKTGVVLWDAQDVDRMDPEAVAVSLLHEIVGHWLRDHAVRMPAGADPKQWNLAGDCEINDDLAKMGFRHLPAGLVMPAHFGCKDGLCAEEYFGVIRKLAGKAKAAMEAMGSKPGAGQGWCGGAAGRPVDGEPKEKGKGAAQGRKPGQGPAGEAEGDGQGGLPEGRTEAEKQRIASQVARDIQQHAASKGRGSVPAGWLIWADDLLKPAKVDWRKRLAALVRDAITYRPGAIVTSWKQAGRKQAGIGYGNGKPMTPCWRNPQPRVAVVVDTSGSMGKEELALAVSETAGVLKACGGEVEFCACDAEVHSLKTITRPSEMADLLKGGGGTDFVPAFEALCKRRLPPEVIIFITDGCGPAPAACPRGVKVIWVICGPYARRPVEWGTCVRVGEDIEEVA